MANRTIAIGDIHGCMDALTALIDVIAPESSDTIITLGDYVDRGPQSAQVIDFLTELISVCRLIPILGNHEIMMTNALKSRREFEFWLFNGGKSTLQSYGGDMNKLPMHHRTFLNHCQRFFQTEDHIFLHAAYDAQLPLDQQPDELLFWTHVGDNFIPEPHVSGKVVFCGHTPQVDGNVLDLGHIKLIDTFCYGDQWLTAIDVDTGEVIQARADGTLRDTASHFSVPAGIPTASIDTTFQVDVSDWPLSLASPSALELDGEHFKSMLQSVGDELAEHLDTLDKFPVKNNQTGDEVTKQLVEAIPQQAASFDGLLRKLFDDYIPVAFNTASPGYLAYIPGGGLPESAIADLIASVTNRYVSVWQASPTMAQMETTVIRWFCDMIGLGPNAGGILTTGGSIANLSAILAARVKKMGDDFGRARLYTSNQAHHCIHKAAFMAGFPRSNLREVPVDQAHSIDIPALRSVIDADRAAGFQPLMVIANAGTTNTGAVDDLSAIAEICKNENLWMHVDAAYGGFFMLTEHGRSVMQGIEQADSVVLDPHKGMFLPYGTGCLLVNNRDDLLAPFQFTSDYMPQMTGDRAKEDFCEISPELSRDNRGLRLWLPLKLHGIGVFEQLLQEKLDLTTWAHDKLQQIGSALNQSHTDVRLEILNPSQLSIVAFSLLIDGKNQAFMNEINQHWLDEINRQGSVMLTSTLVDDQFMLRICVLSFRTHIDRMQICMQAISDAAATVLSEQMVSKT